MSALDQLAYRRRMDGRVTLCDASDPDAAPLVVCRGMEPSARERQDARTLLMLRRRQVRLKFGEHQ